MNAYILSGMTAESLGGVGGDDNGNGGPALGATGYNYGTVIINLTSGDGAGLFGMQSLAIGSAGTTSNDNSDNGGNGGDAESAEAYSYGTISLTGHVDSTVYADAYPMLVGAAMMARAHGGKGGTGPEEDHSGGNGGNAGTVTAHLYGPNGKLTTAGAALYGILAQSIGGQGGDSGATDGNTHLAGTGGGGGFGGDGGEVDVTADSDTSITTGGDYATGIVAQSIGGGGGIGGEFQSVLGGQAGNGGNGGDSGNVNVYVYGPVTTTGDHALGVLAQSIAGSGGTGGVETGGAVALGGDGAGGGTPGSVFVQSAAIIDTSGYSAPGMAAQSIGGGGGMAGSATGLMSVGGNAADDADSSSGGQVTAFNNGNIQTGGDAAIGLLTQSIGGGGGSGGDSNGVAGVGGQGGSGGNGGQVDIGSLGTVTTQGDSAIGVLAQSIGGGGGNGGDTLTISTVASIGIGGNAAGGGNGGGVYIDDTGTSFQFDQGTSPGNITTLGDYASGVMAQSVGGGGGNGGSVKNYSALSFLALQVGGNGGGGGGGGNAIVRQQGMTVYTSGAHATGVLAQSVGGGGGNGGDASYADGTAGFNAALIVGGGGGGGGDVEGNVTVDLQNSVIATGVPPEKPQDMTDEEAEAFAPDDAIGVLAQSIGGGGGTGGSSTAKDLVVAFPTGTGVSVAANFQAAIGGNGGDGGDGNDVVVSLTDGTSVTTLGDGSHAVVAQSIGGGGGTGGDASVLSYALGDKDTLSMTAGIALGGGSGHSLLGYNYGGESGGSGSTVTVTLGNTGGPSNGEVNMPASSPSLAPANDILTYGDNADGVLAQSVGGGGGNGGLGNSSAYTLGSLVGITAKVGVGGTGGGGGNGGVVTVTQNPGQVIETQGSGSRGIVAQSIGGGGGASQGGTLFLSGGVAGVKASLTVGVGATGGSGGYGDSVTGNIRGIINTYGGGADGVLLQSIGGGGGIGGSVGADGSSEPILYRLGRALKGIGPVKDGGVYTMKVDVGGQGGNGGGHNGQVSLDFNGQIATQGDWADGVVAQSIGGGGGVGGSATASGSSVIANTTVAVGGNGGLGGDGGAVIAQFDASGTVGNTTYAKSITTHGYMAHGVVLQSIGGGGGQGGDGSDQSKGVITVGASVGGGGGVSGNGNAVKIVPLDDGGASYLVVKTQGDDAIGLVAQSIGGGGGIGGAGNATTSKSSGALQYSVTVGGNGGVSGNGGPVNLNTEVAITTAGDRAYGLVAQSIGGGGGIGGAGSADHLTSVTLGGTNGASGDGGEVTLNLPHSSITTSGAGAHGIVAQSIGGGGGIAGDASGGAFHLLSYTSDADNDGEGSDVLVTFGGGITTKGANAYGIIAQTISGGGGFGGDQSGPFVGSVFGVGDTSGKVTVNQTGTISATGENSVGIFAQSEAGAENQAITVTIGGSVTGGSGSGKGVWIAGGENNQLTVEEGASVSAASGVAIRYDGDWSAYDRTLTVDNYGTITGDIQLYNLDGANAGTVNNYSSDTLIGASLYAANVMNAGRLVVGDLGKVDGTEITGDFTQTAAGTLATDVDFNRSDADLLSVDGGADLAGTLAVQPLSLRPGRTVTVLSVDGSTTGALHPQHSPIYDFALARAGHDVHLSVAAAHFDATSMRLHHNQAHVADHLQAIWDTGGTDSFGRLFGALGTAADQGSDAYSDTLSDLSPGVALAPAAQTQAGVARFNGALMSCPRFFGTNALTGEGNCYWGQVTSLSSDHDSEDGVSGFNTIGTLYQIGRQSEVARGWFVDVSGAYQHSDLDGSEDRVSGDGDTFYAGAALKHEMGPWLVAGALSASYGDFDMQRRITIPGFTGAASSDPEVYAGSARVRVARTFASAHAYLKPYVDLDAIYARMPGYRESGTGDIALDVDNSDQFTFAFSPTLELGGRFDGDHGSHLRPYAYAGLTALSDSDWTTTARFTGAPRDLGGFDTTLPMDDLMARVGAGVEIYTGKGVNVRLQYDGEFSDDLSSNNASLKVMIPFGA